MFQCIFSTAGDPRPRKPHHAGSGVKLAEDVEVGGVSSHISSSYLFSHLSLSQNSPGLLQQPEEEGSQIRSAGSRSGSVQVDQNSNIRGEGSLRPTFGMNQFFSKRITGSGETLKEIQEGMALTARIMKKGLRHQAELKQKISWSRVTIV